MTVRDCKWNINRATSLSRLCALPFISHLFTLISNSCHFLSEMMCSNL